jgi:hypothetical protein
MNHLSILGYPCSHTEFSIGKMGEGSNNGEHRGKSQNLKSEIQFIKWSKTPLAIG